MLEANGCAWQALLYSIISVLAMTYSDNGQRDTLHYRLISQSSETPGEWGNEYVRHLASEIGEEYSLIINGAAGIEPTAEPINPTPASADAMAVDGEAPSTVSAGTQASPAATTVAGQKAVRPLKTKEELLGLALDLVPFFLQHNAEADAVDLLLELESVDRLSKEGFLDGKKGENIYARVCQYMVR